MTPRRGIRPARRPSVVIVEDDADAAEGLGALLEHRGCAVIIALDGRSALAEVAAHRPDAVLADLGLPDMSGFDLARSLRAAAPERPPVLIAISGYVDTETVERAREAGFDHHRAKPLDVEEVLRLLHPACHPGVA
jgi:CheY-like chemotaxis protein